MRYEQYISIRESGSTGNLTIGVFSDPGYTTPITTTTAGSTVYIKAFIIGSFTASDYWLYIGTDSKSKIRQVNSTGEFTYTVDLYGDIEIAIIAGDGSAGIAQSEPFILSNPEVFPPSILGCVLWINADDLSTYTFNGADVAQQDDLSGLSNNISAPAVVNQPEYIDTDLGINGLRSVRYRGAEYQLTPLSLDIISGSSVFIVVQFYQSDTGGIIHNGNTPTDNTPYFFIQQQGTNVRVYGGGAGYSSSYPIVLNTTYLLEVHRTSTSEEFYINGTLQYTRAIGTAGNRNNLYINTSFGGQASTVIGDIDVHNINLSSADRLTIRNYLIDKWNI